MQLVTCKTNGLCLKAMFGDRLQNWVGKRVTLFPGEWNGEPCIRVWGSPDIPADISVDIRLPRRKPFRMTMHRVDLKPAQAEKAGSTPATQSAQLAQAPLDQDLF